MAIKKYIYDFEKVLQERDGADALQSEYTSTTELYGDLLSAFDGTSTNYYEPDSLGSTDALIDESQSVKDRWKYRGFGAATQTLGAAGNPFTFVGRQSYYNDSETGLYLLGSGTSAYAFSGTAPGKSGPEAGQSEPAAYHSFDVSSEQPCQPATRSRPTTPTFWMVSTIVLTASF